jgi:hypothetical protein
MAKIPIACTLNADEASDRLTEWRTLATRVVNRVEIDGGMRVHFDESVTAGHVADLADRERTCCRFFLFVLLIDASGVALEVRAPEAAQGLITELVG